MVQDWHRYRRGVGGGNAAPCSAGTSRQSDETKKDVVPVRNVYIPPLHVLVSTMGLGAERALAARPIV